MDNSRRTAFSILYPLFSILVFILRISEGRVTRVPDIFPGLRSVSILYLLSSILAFTLTGCSTAPLPPTNLSTPGWTVQQGQAVWKPIAGRPDIAGDLLMATNTDGDCFIQFTKTPLTLATARISDGRWQLEFGNDQYSWRGKNPPPTRFVWFQLPRALAGTNIARNWQFQSTTNGWQFANHHTGETLEGEFFQ
ncbi:MAG TPA: hypothetical protein VGN23_02490 [Verrucomicrobiae bacterium]